MGRPTWRLDSIGGDGYGCLGVGEGVVARRQWSGRELSIEFLRWWYRAEQGKGGAVLQERRGTSALHQCLTRPSIGLDALPWC